MPMRIIESGSTASGRILAGTPRAIARDGTSTPPDTTAPAPTSAPLRTTASCSTTAPEPTSEPSSIVQPSRCTRWPTTHSAPTLVGWIGVTCRTDPSWIDVRAPIVIGAPSPRSTAPGQIEAAADHDPVVAGLVHRLDAAVDPGQHVVQHRRTGAGRRPPADPGELVVALGGEDPGLLLLVVRQDVHAVVPGRLDRRVARRRLAGEERH